MFSQRLSIVLTLTMLLAPAMAVAHSPPQHARVYFIGLEDGAVVQLILILNRTLTCV